MDDYLPKSGCCCMSCSLEFVNRRLVDGMLSGGVTRARTRISVCLPGPADLPWIIPVARHFWVKTNLKAIDDSLLSWRGLCLLLLWYQAHQRTVLLPFAFVIYFWECCRRRCRKATILPCERSSLRRILFLIVLETKSIEMNCSVRTGGRERTGKVEEIGTIIIIMACREIRCENRMNTVHSIVN